MLILLGMGLCIEQGILVNDIELHVHALLVEEAAHQGDEVVKSHSSAQGGGMEFHVIEGPVGCDSVVQLGDGISCRRGAADIRPHIGRDAICHRRVGQSSVRRRSGLRPQRHIGRYRVEAGLVLASAWVAVSLDRLGIGISGNTGEFIDLILVIAELGLTQDSLPEIFIEFLDIGGQF